MEIKTIVFQLDSAEKFDNAVNAAMAEGWHLVKRDVILPMQPHNKTSYFLPGLYAELAKFPVVEAELQAEPITWQDAMRIIKHECNSHDHCADCPAEDVCNVDSPHMWDLTKLPEASHD